MALQLYKCRNCRNSLWLSRSHKRKTIEKCLKCHKECLPQKRRNLSDAENDLFNGNLRCFGHYKCFQCNRFWKSGNSWTNKGQKCNQCGKLLLAFYQTPLKPNGTNGRSKMPHNFNNCMKCQELGVLCVTRSGFTYNDINDRANYHNKRYDDLDQNNYYLENNEEDYYNSDTSYYESGDYESEEYGSEDYGSEEYESEDYESGDYESEEHESEEYGSEDYESEDYFDEQSQADEQYHDDEANQSENYQQDGTNDKAYNDEQYNDDEPYENNNYDSYSENDFYESYSNED